MPKHNPETFCSICGMAITKMTAGSHAPEFEMYDFIERKMIYTDLTMCEECTRRFMQYRKGGLKAAKVRTRALQEMS